MRYPKNAPFCAEGGRRLPARTFVSRPDTGWIGRGTAFSDATVKRRCTLIVVWYAEQEEPWTILTGHAPGEAGASWYALRFWIEPGFKMLKSAGWQWQRTRRTGPERISRHWLALSAAALMVLAYGTRACPRPRPGGGDAFDRKAAPGSLRAPPKWLAPTHRSSRSRPGRTVSLIHHRIGRLRRLMHRGKLWSRVWLLPEPWPEPKPRLEINRHAPT